MINWPVIFNQYRGREIQMNIRVLGRKRSGSKNRIRGIDKRKQNQHEKITL